MDSFGFDQSRWLPSDGNRWRNHWWPTGLRTWIAVAAYCGRTAHCQSRLPSRSRSRFERRQPGMDFRQLVGKLWTDSHRLVNGHLKLVVRVRRRERCIRWRLQSVIQIHLDPWLLHVIAHRGPWERHIGRRVVLSWWTNWTNWKASNRWS